MPPLENTPNAYRLVPADVDSHASALPADSMIPKQVRAGREGRLKGLEGPHGLVAVGDQHKRARSAHLGTANSMASRSRFSSLPRG